MRGIGEEREGNWRVGLLRKREPIISQRWYLAFSRENKISLREEISRCFCKEVPLTWPILTILASQWDTKRGVWDTSKKGSVPSKLPETNDIAQNGTRDSNSNK